MLKRSSYIQKASLRLSRFFPLFACLFLLHTMPTQASVPTWNMNGTNTKPTDSLSPAKWIAAVATEESKKNHGNIPRGNYLQDRKEVSQYVRLAANGQDSFLLYMPAILSGGREKTPPQEPNCPVRPPDNSPNILFEEQFYNFSSNVWSASGDIPKLDSFSGDPVCPSLFITKGQTTSNQSWSLEAGLELHVKIRVKHTDLTCLPGLPTLGYTGFYVTNLSGNTLAGIRFLIPACPVEDELDFDYYHASSYNDHSGDGFGWPPYEGQFVDFKMQIAADGYIKWYRDGYLKYISKFPLNTQQPVRIKLWGDSATMRIYFDDIRIYQ